MTAKITRLSPTEVANNAALPSEMKRRHLLGIESPQVYWGYDPVRNNVPSLLLAESPLFDGVFGEELPIGSDEQVITKVGKDCKSGPSQKKSNMAVAQALVKWRNTTGARGRVLTSQPEPYRLSVDTIQFCFPTVIVVSGELYLVNFDPRASLVLSPNGREVVKSMIWHTAKIGDLKEAQVAMLRTPSVGKGIRKAVLEPLLGEPKYGMDELDAMIMETYSIWETILMERRSKDADGSEASGGLFG